MKKKISRLLETINMYIKAFHFQWQNSSYKVGEIKITYTELLAIIFACW